MKVSKSRLVSFLATTAMLVLAGVSVPTIAHAQSEMGLKIPFDFYVGNQRFAAGSYTVLVSTNYVKISDGNGHSAFSITNAVANPGWRNANAGAVVFNHYDGYYFLTEVRRSGYSFANGLLKAPLEIQVARNSGIKEQLAFGAGH